ALDPRCSPLGVVRCPVLSIRIERPGGIMKRIGEAFERRGDPLLPIVQQRVCRLTHLIAETADASLRHLRTCTAFEHDALHRPTMPPNKPPGLTMARSGGVPRCQRRWTREAIT